MKFAGNNNCYNERGQDRRDDECSRIGPKILTEVEEGETIAKNQPSRCDSEGSGSENVPDVDLNCGLEARVEERIGERIDD